MQRADGVARSTTSSERWQLRLQTLQHHRLKTDTCSGKFRGRSRHVYWWSLTKKIYSALERWTRPEDAAASLRWTAGSGTLKGTEPIAVLIHSNMGWLWCVIFVCELSVKNVQSWIRWLKPALDMLLNRSGGFPLPVMGRLIRTTTRSTSSRVGYKYFFSCFLPTNNNTATKKHVLHIYGDPW